MTSRTPSGMFSVNLRQVADPVVALAADHADVGEVHGGLFDEERIALGLFVEGEGERARHLVAAAGGQARPRREQRLHAVGVESAQQDALVQPLAPQLAQHFGERMAPVEVDVAVGADDEQAAAGQPPGEVLQQQQARLVGPVDVVEDEQQRGGLRGVDQKRGDRLEQPVAFGFRLLRWRPPGGPGCACEFPRRASPGVGRHRPTRRAARRGPGYSHIGAALRRTGHTAARPRSRSTARARPGRRAGGRRPTAPRSGVSCRCPVRRRASSDSRARRWRPPCAP